MNSTLSRNLALSDDQVEEFFDKGYVVIPNLFSTEEIEEIKASLDRLFLVAQRLRTTQTYGGTQFVVDGPRVDRIVWCGAMEPNLLKFGTDPRLLVPSAQLLRSPEMDQLICQAHFKMPGDSVEFPWHQDSQHRGYGTPDWEDVNGTGSYVQTIIAIDPMKISNGTVYFQPGTGRAGHLALDQPENQRMHVQLDRLIPIEAEPGTAMFFGPYAIHGSEPNHSTESRRIFINGFAYPGANRRVYPGEGSGRRVRVPVEWVQGHSNQGASWAPQISQVRN